jgi:endonuclease YncB( thermonuclease family)
MRRKLRGGLGAPKRWTRYGAILGAGIAILTLGLLPDRARAESFALDGDDICIGGIGRQCTGGEDYRLHGVDAFESGQTCKDGDGQTYGCGAKAKEALAAIIAGHPVSCVRVKRDRDRWIGNCVAGNVDVEAELVRAGWAFVRPDFLDGAREAQLCAIEAEARAAKRGMWAGSWDQRPYFWKGGKRKTLVQISCPPHDQAASQ